MVLGDGKGLDKSSVRLFFYCKLCLIRIITLRRSAMVFSEGNGINSSIVRRERALHGCVFILSFRI